jgi:hypothetical protein
LNVIRSPFRLGLGWDPNDKQSYFPLCRSKKQNEPDRPLLVFAATEQESAMSLGDEIDKVFRREVKSLPAYEKAQAASGSGVAPPVDEMNQLLMGLVIAAQRSCHLLAERIEQIDSAYRGAEGSEKP